MIIETDNTVGELTEALGYLRDTIARTEAKIAEMQDYLQDLRGHEIDLTNAIDQEKESGA